MIRSKEITDKILELDAGDNLEVKIENRLSMGDNEQAGDIVVERIKTADYIRITRIYDAPRPINENRIHGHAKGNVQFPNAGTAKDIKT